MTYELVTILLIVGAGLAGTSQQRISWLNIQASCWWRRNNNTVIALICRNNHLAWGYILSRYYRYRFGG